MPSKSKSPGYIGQRLNACFISFLAISADLPKFCNISIALSNFEYCTEHKSGSMKSLIDKPGR